MHSTEPLPRHAAGSLPPRAPGVGAGADERGARSRSRRGLRQAGAGRADLGRHVHRRPDRRRRGRAGVRGALALRGRQRRGAGRARAARRAAAAAQRAAVAGRHPARRHRRGRVQPLLHDRPADRPRVAGVADRRAQSGGDLRRRDAAVRRAHVAGAGPRRAAGAGRRCRRHRPRQSAGAVLRRRRHRRRDHLRLRAVLVDLHADRQADPGRAVSAGGDRLCVADRHRAAGAGRVVAAGAA